MAAFLNHFPERERKGQFQWMFAALGACCCSELSFWLTVVGGFLLWSLVSGSQDLTGHLLHTQREPGDSTAVGWRQNTISQAQAHRVPLTQSTRKHMPQWCPVHLSGTTYRCLWIVALWVGVACWICGRIVTNCWQLLFQTTMTVWFFPPQAIKLVLKIYWSPKWEISGRN
jgi:hypothetical protein